MSAMSRQGCEGGISEQSIQVDQLPDDMQDILMQFFEHCGKELPTHLPVKKFDISRFPVVPLADGVLDERGVKYAKKMVGESLPPIIVCGRFWLDGRHRVWAARSGGEMNIHAIDLDAILAPEGMSSFKFIGKLDKERGDMIDDRIVVAKTSLTPESARLVRFERMIAGQPNPPAKARMRGFLDHMMGNECSRADLGVKLQVSYDQGWRRGEETRILLKGRPWIETSNERNGSKWDWAVYCEGYWRSGGAASSQSRAYDEIIEARIDIAEGKPEPSANDVREDRVARDRPRAG